MERHNDWMSYAFDGIDLGKKLNRDSKFTLKINKKIDRNPAACVSPILIKHEYAIKGKNKIKT